MPRTNIARKERQSGVELLKILAIILIIISHITQTLQQNNGYISYSNYIYDFSIASLSGHIITLQFMRSFGAFGNLIFFICSAWFLLSSDSVNGKKWLEMLLEVWSVSVIIALAFILQGTSGVSTKLMIQSFLPNYYANNWYITCYLLFYPIHVFLNKMISQIGKKTHLRFVVCAFVIYYIICFVIGGFYFYSDLLLWMILYMFMSYIQKYLSNYVSNIKKNAAVGLVSMVSHIVIIILSNLAGMRLNMLSNSMLRWGVSNNPFLLLASISLFNLSINCRWKSKTINYISSLSLLIYIIHENILIRTYVRPKVLEYIHSNYGYKFIILWVLILAIATFVLSIVLSIIYKYTAGRLIRIAADVIYGKIKIFYCRVEEKLLAIK